MDIENPNHIHCKKNDQLRFSCSACICILCGYWKIILTCFYTYMLMCIGLFLFSVYPTMVRSIQLNEKISNITIILMILASIFSMALCCWITCCTGAHGEKCFGNYLKKEGNRGCYNFKLFHKELRYIIFFTIFVQILPAILYPYKDNIVDMGRYVFYWSMTFACFMITTHFIILYAMVKGHKNTNKNDNNIIFWSLYILLSFFPLVFASFTKINYIDVMIFISCFIGQTWVTVLFTRCAIITDKKILIKKGIISKDNKCNLSKHMSEYFEKWKYYYCVVLFACGALVTVKTNYTPIQLYAIIFGALTGFLFVFSLVMRIFSCKIIPDKTKENNFVYNV